MHQPGIEPGTTAWKAIILPLNHWCLLSPTLLSPITNQSPSFSFYFLFYPQYFLLFIIHYYICNIYTIYFIRSCKTVENIRLSKKIESLCAGLSGHFLDLRVPLMAFPRSVRPVPSLYRLVIALLLQPISVLTQSLLEFWHWRFLLHLFRRLAGAFSRITTSPRVIIAHSTPDMV